MERTTGILILVSTLVALIAAVINPYLGGVVALIAIVVVMVRLVMEESTALPGIDAWLREDARGIVIKNTGNSPAEKIHVTLVPLDIEYEIASLPAERTHEYPLSSMVSEVRLILRFENDKAELFLRTFDLSALIPEYDPFRPMIPLFRWKK